MSRSVEGQLCLHGAIIMFAAFVSGMLIGVVAMGQVQGSVENWKVGHMEALINAIVLFAIAGCIGKLAISEGKAKLVAACLIIMAYCNTVFGLMRGATGAMGYQFDGSLANNITAFAGMLGVPLAVIAFSIILVSALRTKTSE